MTWRPRFCQGKTAKILGSNTIFKIQNAFYSILTFEFIQYSITQRSEVLLTSWILLDKQALWLHKRWKGGCKGHLGLTAMLNAPATPQWHLPLPALLPPHACGPHTLQRNCKYLPPWFQILQQVDGLFSVDEDPLTKCWNMDSETGSTVISPRLVECELRRTSKQNPFLKAPCRIQAWHPKFIHLFRLFTSSSPHWFPLLGQCERFASKKHLIVNFLKAAPNKTIKTLALCGADAPSDHLWNSAMQRLHKQTNSAARSSLKQLH